MIVNFTHYLQSLQVNFQRGSERSHYPTLKALIDDSMTGINAVIEEKGNQAGIPDFTVRKNGQLVGYIEAKDINKNLDIEEKTEQLERYRESSVGQNLILTNYLELRWYVDGKLKQTAAIAYLEKDTIIAHEKTEEVVQLLQLFLGYRAKDINNYYDLAGQMAVHTKSVKYSIEEALKLEDKTGELTQLKVLFQDLLLPDLDNHTFADMYAQTIAYGLFTARVGHAQHPGQDLFSRKTASRFISNKIPFLQGLFNTVIETDVISKIHWTIEDLVELFIKVDMGSVLERFGQETRRQDPVVHFYETFLAAYESSLRKSRGVYYTPEPVVTFIVQAVNDILDKDFDLQFGLGNRRVTILDPATGTGTFLYEVIKQVYRNFEKYGVNKWSKFLKDTQLLSRIYGFELLMTPYTIAHLKLSLLLENLGYKFDDEERLNIYLTNALEEGIHKSGVLLGQYIAEEANQAAKVKNETPIYVVLGNPPYSGHSENKNSWIEALVKDYYQIDGVPLNERNSKWLQDDYVKFIRFGQWRIDKTNSGILAFVTNHGYLDNPTFRGMRQSLMQSFSKIYILDLHGNSKKKEISPEGKPDQNVFDIQQGVSIGIFVKEPNQNNPIQIYHASLWGNREQKYKLLNELDIKLVKWEELTPSSPFYLFVPQNTNLLEEYNKGWKITDIMSVNVLGFQTHRDNFAIDFERDTILEKISEMRDKKISDQEYAEKYNLKNSHSWQLNEVRQSLSSDKKWKNKITECLYRPFDWRFCYFSSIAMDRPRRELINHVLLKDNLCFNIVRQTKMDSWQHAVVSNIPTPALFVEIKDGSNVFPLYLYPDDDAMIKEEKRPNLSKEFLTAIQEKLGYIPTPEKIFYYAYAIFHSPTYRQRYAEFLKIDFPRLPLTKNDQLFNNLATQGEQLVNLHLLKSDQFNQLITTYEGEGDNQVSQVIYNDQLQRVYINPQKYFANIPKQIWEFKIGGYQVLEKWLKDRKKGDRALSDEDIIHYQKIVIALQQTLKIMTEIDQLIPSFPIQ